jgi:DNA mismatch repair protein MLH3
MPVRVKQRSLALEDRSEQEKQWVDLKKSLVAVIIACGRAVSLRVKGVNSSRQFTFSDSNLQSAREQTEDSNGLSQSGRIRLALSILGQTGLISPSNTSSWIPASASSKTAVIKGVISLEPMPTKSIQFLSLGIHPLPHAAHNELYGHINRIFSRSHFGVVEDDVPNEEERRRRQQDKRFKQDGLTNKQKVIEKGIDRWPMFVLNISLKDSKGYASTEALVQSESSLKAIIDVLDALITGWLASHHFLPQNFQARKKRKLHELESESEDGGLERRDVCHGFTSTQLTRQMPLRTSRPSTAPSAARASMERAKDSKSDSMKRPYTGIANFNKLSRIKSSTPSFPGSPLATFQKANKPFVVPNNSSVGSHQTPGFRAHSVSPFLNNETVLTTKDVPIHRPTSKLDAIPSNQPLLESSPAHELNLSPYEDEVQDWTDPITNQCYKVNARTGAAIISDEVRSKHIVDGNSRNVSDSSIRLKSTKFARAASVGLNSKGFLNNLLRDWKNPVFPTSEKSIPQVSLELSGRSKFNSVLVGNETSFDQISKTNASKLTKSGLRKAKVIAQVDKKFILVTMIAEEKERNEESAMLVIIDQHAADERCRVEDLFADLCMPASNDEVSSSMGQTPESSIKTATLPKALLFRISEREGHLLVLHAATFARWGILYDIKSPCDAQGMKDLVVRALPPVIAERSRLEPKLFIDLIRTELWNIADDVSHFKSHTSAETLTHPSPTAHSETGEKERQWLDNMHTFPQGIIDMINSRACRSAIMFNDTLSIPECEDLVKRLGDCKFPFICAHGRPSMVPLVRLGGDGGGLGGLGGFGKDNGKGGDGEGEVDGFVTAFKKWQREGVQREATELRRVNT